MPAPKQISHYHDGRVLFKSAFKDEPYAVMINPAEGSLEWESETGFIPAPTGEHIAEDDPESGKGMLRMHKDHQEAVTRRYRVGKDVDQREDLSAATRRTTTYLRKLPERLLRVWCMPRRLARKRG